MRDMQIASGLVERSIRELDAAAMFDRKDIDDNPRVDTRMGRGSRFREILPGCLVCSDFRNDISQEEDNPRAAQWRNRAFGFIDDAMAMVQKGGYDKLRDETIGVPIPPPRAAVHPRYLSAIADLRYARALLYRPDWREIMRDQRGAVEEIDRAIAEAKQAAIDDGKNPDDHPLRLHRPRTRLGRPFPQGNGVAGLPGAAAISPSKRKTATPPRGAVLPCMMCKTPKTSWREPCAHLGGGKRTCATAFCGRWFS